MWDATKDHVKKQISMIKTFKGKESIGIFYIVMFDNSCWYKKCTFCNVENHKIINTIKGVDKDKVFESLLLNLEQYKTRNLYIGDPFFVFTDDKKYILERLRNRGIRVAIATGIQSLMNREYIDNLNRYVNEIRVGIESCSDFSLSYINKGYGWNDIQHAMSNIINHLSKGIYHRWLYIADLAERNKAGVIENYRRLDYMQSTFRKAGFDFDWIPRHLIIFPSTEVSKNTEYIRITKNNPNVSGIWAVYNHMKQYFDVNISESLVIPFERYDESGKLLPSDLDLVKLPPV